MPTYPNNPNFLSPLGFKFQLKKTPNTNFFVQSAVIPQLTLGTATVPTPFANLPMPGDKITFSELQITFKVDEDLTNYMELFNWIVALGHPQSFEQYGALAAKPAYTGEGVYSEASLIILNSAKRPTNEIHFYDLYPTSLSDIQMDTRNTDVDYVTCTASFAYRMFDIRAL